MGVWEMMTVFQVHERRDGGTVSVVVQLFPHSLQALRGAVSLWNLQRSKTGHRLSATRHDAVTKQYSLMHKGSSSSGSSARLCCVSRTL